MVAIKQLMGVRHEKRCRIYSRNRDLRFVDMAIVSAERHRDAGQRIVDRPADAQFAIRAVLPRGRTRQEDAGNQLVLVELHPRVAFVGVEILERDAAQTFWPGNFDGSTEAEQRRRSIGRKRRPAFRAAGRDMAEIAILLDAEAAGLAPCERLVVPQAASIEADVAA